MNSLRSAASSTMNNRGTEAADASPLRSYLPESLLVLLFCLTPVAIPAVLYALTARRRASEGNLAEARKVAESARVWFIFSVCYGVTINLAIIGAYLVLQKR